MKEHEHAREMEKVKAFYARAAEKYSAYQHSRYSHPSNFNDLLTWISISENLPAMKGAPILDAGSGPGGWALRIAREGYRVHLLDISEACINEAKRLFEKEGLEATFYVGDISDMSDIPSNHYGLTICLLDPIGYCGKNAEKAIAELARVTMVGGKLIVSVDNIYRMVSSRLAAHDLDSVIMLFEERLMIGEGEALYRPFAPRELANAVRVAGLDVLSIRARPSITAGIPQDVEKAIFNDPELLGKFLAFELEFGTDPDLAGFGQQVEVVAIKRQCRR